MRGTQAMANVTGRMTGSRTVADAVVSRLSRDGIDTVFGLTGGGIMYLIDALSRSDQVDLVATHHEEFAGVAADGYSRAGKPYGVAFATTGPGAAHLFTAIAAAWQDSSPVLFIVGQVKTADSSHIRGLQIRQNGTFEFDTTRTFAPICKSVDVVCDPKEIENVLDRAIALCRQGRPGPVVIELPLDVQGAVISDPQVQGLMLESTDSYSISVSSDNVSANFRETLQRALRISSKPLVMLGVGVVRAGLQEEFGQLLNDAGLPYVVTQFARGAGRKEHELFLGSPGIKANRSANIAVSECDLLIALGTSLHQQVTGWDSDAFKSLPSFKIWTEPDAAVLTARSHLVNEAFPLTVQAALEQMSTSLPLLSAGEKTHSLNEWRARCAHLRKETLLHYPAHEELLDRMCLYRAVSTISDFSRSFAATVTDAGITWYVMAQHYFPAENSNYLASGSFGGMGMALPMAIGAACATKGRVLALTGDGSLMTCLSEMATLRQSGLPVVLIVNSNDGYLSIKATHDRYFAGRRIGTDGTNGVLIPPISDLAGVFNLPFRRVGSETQLRKVLEEITADSWHGPVVIELLTYVDQVVQPIVESRRSLEGSFVSATLADMTPPWDGDDVN